MKVSLCELGAEADNYYHESDLIATGKVNIVIDQLKKSDLCNEEKGAYYLDLEKENIAGRNQKKLEDLSKNLGINCKIFIADGNDLSALNEITKQTKVVLTTAGPFHRYGSKLVASCVENSTHYVDITGENFWVKKMIEKHHEKAKKKGVRIVPSCGYDSVPSDLGCFFAAKAFGKKIKNVLLLLPNSDATTTKKKCLL